MPRGQVEKLERKLQRLDRLQNLSTRFERVSKTLANVTAVDAAAAAVPVAVEKSMELRRRDYLFSRKLRLSRDLSRISETNPTNLLNRVKARQESRGLLKARFEQGKTKIKREQPQQATILPLSPGSSALAGLRVALEEQKRRAVVKRARLQEIREANAAADRSMVMNALRRRTFSSKIDDGSVSVITDPTYFSPRNPFDENSLSLNDDISEMNEESTVEFVDEIKQTDDSAFEDSNHEKQEKQPPPQGKQGKEVETSSVNTPATAVWTEVSSDYCSSSGVVDDAASVRSNLLKEQIKTLEEEKKERARSVSSVLLSYRCKDVQLEMEKEFLRDAQDTTYTELKVLLVKQHQESEYLRARLSAMEQEKKKKKSSGFPSLFFLFAIIGAICWAFFAVNPMVLNSSVVKSSTWDGLCAPAEPGSVLTPESGVVSAPWWVPEGPLKQPLFHMAGCGSRPRLQMEIKGGMLHVGTEDKLLFKKNAKKVFVETGNLQIVDRRGGHLELEAPWAFN